MPEQGALELTKELIARRSITPEDGGCQELIAARLARAGFRNESMEFGDVTNLWARRGASSPVVCFAGHTDVVPTGPLSEWHSDPFVPTVRDGKLVGAAEASAWDVPAGATVNFDGYGFGEAPSGPVEYDVTAVGVNY